MADRQKTVISVVSCDVFKTGTSDAGKPWTIYEVVATDRNGNPIDKTLKSFELLKGENIEVELEKNDRGYDEYILRTPGGGGGGGKGGSLGPSIDALRARVEVLEQKVAAIEDRATPTSDIPPDPLMQPAAAKPPPDDDDIPF